MRAVAQNAGAKRGLPSVPGVPGLGVRTKRPSIGTQRYAAGGSGGGNDKAELREAKKLLKELLAHKSAWPFSRPVDITQYYDYYQTIDVPMDLGTMKVRSTHPPLRTPALCRSLPRSPARSRSLPLSHSRPPHWCDAPRSLRAWWARPTPYNLCPQPLTLSPPHRPLLIASVRRPPSPARPARAEAARERTLPRPLSLRG